jgi:hypothetical protein
MPLKKLLLKPGVNRKILGTQLKVAGTTATKSASAKGPPRRSAAGYSTTRPFLGVCRSLIKWVTLSNQALLGVGTNIKYYLELGTVFYDITPIRRTSSVGAVTFAATNGSTTITVTDVGNGAGCWGLRHI